MREETRAPEAVVALVAATVEKDEPADRERDVEEPVPDVEPVDETRIAQQRSLDRRLDVEPSRSSSATIRSAFRRARARPSRRSTSRATTR